MTNPAIKPGDLCAAVEKRDIERAKELLEQGADPNDLSDEKFRETPLIYAACHNNVELAELLLGKGADPDQADSGGRTALHYAAQTSPGILRLLIDRGVPINRKDNFGETAMDHAQTLFPNSDPKLHAEARQLLLEAPERQKFLAAERERLASLHRTAVKKQAVLKKVSPKILRPS